MENYFDKSKVILYPISKEVARNIIIQNHYSHSWTKCAIAFGVYYREKTNSFFEENGSERLIGAIVYGDPVGRLVAASVSPLLGQGDVLELTRLWLADGYGSNIESYCVGQTFKYIRKHMVDVKCIISYSDPEAGHKGIIYQALNFLYQGTETRKVDSYWYRIDQREGWLHPRTISARYGTTNDDALLKMFPDGFQKREMLRKHRYVLFLRNRNKYISTLTHKILPYPKNETKLDEVIIQVGGQNESRS